jgi:hypothetical protein
MERRAQDSTTPGITILIKQFYILMFLSETNCMSDNNECLNLAAGKKENL